MSPPHPWSWKSIALSSDQRPGPRHPIANDAAIRFMRYSQPSVGRRNTKNPALRWFVMNATVSVPMIAPAASGVSNPTTSPAPAASSVRLASHACRMPGFMPRLANQPAVPLILPPR